MPGSFERMLQLVNEFFDTRNHPDQISVTEKDRNHLAQIHPATLSEYADEAGPIVWILMIPTLKDIMMRFVSGEITEQQLLDETPEGVKYDSIYLSSASVLPEYRRKGLAKRVTVDAIKRIREDNPVTSLFYWPFSEEGKALASAVAREVGLPLYMRGEHQN